MVTERESMTLPAFLSHYAPLADQAAQGGWSHIHYLDELAALEAVERTERRIVRLLRESKLSRDKTLACARPTPRRRCVLRSCSGLRSMGSPLGHHTATDASGRP